MRLFARLRRDRRGSAVLEFSVIAPLLVTFILGGFQLAQALHANSSIREAVGNAGREAVVSYQITSDGVMSEAQIEALVASEAVNSAHRLKAANLTVDATISGDLGDWRQLTIAATYDFPVNVPFMAPITIDLDQSRIFYIPD